MWKVYTHTRMDEDYTIYKETFNADTTEIRHNLKEATRKKHLT